MELKKLMEQRAELQEEMETLLDGAKTEERAMSEEENTKFNDIEGKIKSIDTTIKNEERARELKMDKDFKKDVVEERAAAEEKVFASYLRGIVENRADVNMTTTDNGALIPTTIASKIIAKVYDICPIYQKATRYNVKGNLTIPYYDESTQAITMAYADEFTELESTSGETTSIELKGFLAGVLTKVSLSLVNNNAFDIVSYVINKMAENIARWIEKELLKGTTNKIAGMTGVTQSVTTASATAIVSDELIKVKDKVKDAFQNECVWIMSSATRTAIRLLKDANDRYLFQDDVNAEFGGTLLGKPVYVSDNMDDIAATKTVIYYGDLSGLAVKVSEEVNTTILREKFATQHALGVISWVEMDSKVENTQKLAKLVMKTA